MKFAAVLSTLCLATTFAQSQNQIEARKAPASCEQFHIDQKGSNALHAVTIPPTAKCTAKKENGKFIPDPACTPGAINPTVTEAMLKNPAFRTGCIRNEATSEADKTTTYGWYKTPHPAKNTGEDQTCELDHLIPLYLGGADTLDNIWPQCGPAGVALDDRYFKEKDKVEYYLGQQVREGKMDLAKAQQGIATDWTQYLADAEGFCKSGKCDFTGK
jgi:hypothetical protein